MVLLMSSKLRTFPLLWIAAISLVLLTFPYSAAQPASIPESQELLNGLKILIWEKPGSPEVVLKLRIHSGSAFDLAGKSGEMALLGDVLFPDPATIDYFTEQMGGKLNVSVNYDSINITMRGKADQVDHMLEVLRNGVLATQLTPDVVNKIRENRIKLLKDAAVSPSLVADRAIAVRLFGDFPYGRPSAGSPEDLARVDRGDLMLAHERFMTSNNATLAIVGGINKSRALRTLKQLFGPWRKSEQLVPSTFQAAKPPETKLLVVNVPSASTEIRLAWRGVARSDRDYYVAKVAAKVAEDRWENANPELSSKPVFARSESFMLPGIIVMGTTVANASTAHTIASARKAMESLINSPVTPAEIERAKREISIESSPSSPSLEDEPDAWLDMYTYKLTAAPDRAGSIAAISPGDIQRVASRLFKDTPAATVAVGDAPQLKAALQGQIPFEVLGEIVAPPPATKPPIKPGTTTSPR